MSSRPTRGVPAAMARVGEQVTRAGEHVARAHEQFVSRGRIASPQVRAIVAESWRRSLARGVDPAAAAAPVVLTDDELSHARESVRFAATLPMIRSLLTDAAVEAGHLVALGDADGRLLWVDGDRQLLTQAERMGFNEGALWSEAAAGTNAPGTALAIDQAVQIHTHEHFVGAVQHWSCTAVPIHDPATGDVIGVIDVTGGEHVASAIALAMVRSTVVAVEQSMLALPQPRTAETARLEVLGRDRAMLHALGTSRQLSRRHSELLLLLAVNPGGLSGDHLALLLREEDVSPVTVRAEMTRLRRIVGAGMVQSRPYRLTSELRTDVGEVLAAVDQGDISGALRAYRGPVLPSSQSPAVAELRGEVRARLRRAALAGSDPNVLLSFATHEDGRDDLDVLRAALRALPTDSPKRLGVLARIDRVNALFGLPTPRSGDSRPR